MESKYHVGDLIYFAEEKRPYKIRACNKRFLICTKSYPKPKTVLYTIVDLEKGIRGTDNYSLGWCDYYKTEDCEEMLKELQSSCDNFCVDSNCGTYISRRNRIELNIINHNFKTMKKKTSEELEIEVGRLKRSCASYKSENTKLRGKLDVAAQKITELLCENDQLKVSLGSYKASCEDYQTKIADLEARSWWEKFKELFWVE